MKNLATGQELMNPVKGSKKELKNPAQNGIKAGLKRKGSPTFKQPFSGKLKNPLTK